MFNSKMSMWDRFAVCLIEHTVAYFVCIANGALICDAIDCTFKKDCP